MNSVGTTFNVSGLYRGKNIDTEEWVYGYFIYCYEEYTNERVAEIVTTDTERKYRGGYTIDTIFMVDENTVGRCIGHDMFENPIYQGDIIGYFDVGERLPKYTVIDREPKLFSYDISVNHVCVLGNIWDNPAMLENLSKKGDK